LFLVLIFNSDQHRPLGPYGSGRTSFFYWTT